MIEIYFLFLFTAINCQIPNPQQNMNLLAQQKMQDNLAILLNYLNDVSVNNNGNILRNSPFTTQISSPQQQYMEGVQRSNPLIPQQQANWIPSNYESKPEYFKNPADFSRPGSSIDSVPVSLRSFANADSTLLGMPNQGRLEDAQPMEQLGFMNRRPTGGENNFNMAKVRWLRSQSGEAPEVDPGSNVNEDIRGVQLPPIPTSIPSPRHISQSGTGISSLTELIPTNPSIGEPLSEVGDLELRGTQQIKEDNEANKENVGIRGLKFSKLGKIIPVGEMGTPSPKESPNGTTTGSPTPTGASSQQTINTTSNNSNVPSNNTNKPPETNSSSTPLPPPTNGMNTVKKNNGGQVIGGTSSLIPKNSKKPGGKPITNATANRGGKPKPVSVPEPSLPPALPPSPPPAPTPTPPELIEHQNYKLIYFDARGICEPIRLLFHYSKVPFEDARITRKQWLALKDSTIYGKVPILEVDGRPLTYCHTISRFLARTFGLAGKTSWEQAKVDEVSDFHSDVAMDLQPYLYVIAGFHQGDRMTLRKTVFLPSVEKHFPVYVNLLKQAGSGFFVQSGLTWIDFVISEYLTTIKHFEPAILDKYPALTRFIRKVQTLPEIFDYIANREHQPV